MFQLDLWCHRSSRSWRGHCGGAALGPKVRIPRPATMEHSRADTGRVYLAMHLRREMPRGEDRQ